jgi:mannose-1-phosphate guanylyltransferase / phosphomannomutase
MPRPVNAGIYALDPAILDFLSEAPSDFGFDVWPRVIEAGGELYGHRIDGLLVDIGTPGALADAEAALARSVDECGTPERWNL